MRDKRPIRAGALRAALLLALAAVPPGCARGVSSLRWRFDEAVTRTGLQATGLEPLAFDIQNEVVGVDLRELDLHGLSWRPNEKYVAAHHGDRPAGISHRDAFLGLCRYLAVEREMFRAAFLAGDRSLAVAALGRLLHASQDFFSHSSYVDLNPASKELARAGILENAETFPSELKITGYLPGFEPPGEPPGDPYPHDIYAKDSGEQNGEASAPMKDGRTKFDHAETAAAVCTHDMIVMMRNGLREELGYTKFRKLWRKIGAEPDAIGVPLVRARPR